MSIFHGKLSPALALLLICGCRVEAVSPEARADSLLASVARNPELAPTPLQRALASLKNQVLRTRIYDPSYAQIPYPNGDVPINRGVCSDVIIRALRSADMDLQKAVHQDMSRNFDSYPMLWGLRKPDRNIDHRRVANLMAYFQRKGKALLLSPNTLSCKPGDIIAWRLPGGRLHIGMAAETLALDSARPMMVHNIGAGTRMEDVLFAWKILGHYRWFTP